jgi:hypothetical protein
MFHRRAFRFTSRSFALPTKHSRYRFHGWCAHTQPGAKPSSRSTQINPTRVYGWLSILVSTSGSYALLTALNKCKFFRTPPAPLAYPLRKCTQRRTRGRAQGRSSGHSVPSVVSPSYAADCRTLRPSSQAHHILSLHRLLSRVRPTRSLHLPSSQVPLIP